MHIADAMLLVDFVGMDPTWKKINQALLTYVAQHTSSHYVRWYGNAYRAIIGCLFSGDFNTSDYNTKHMGRLWYSYLLHSIPCDKWKEAFSDPCLKFGAQGDDCMGRIPLEWKKYISGLGFGEYLKTRHSHLVKEGSFVSSRSPLSTIDIKTGTLVNVSIKLLQRYFVLNEVTGYPEPFRPTFVVISKLLGESKAITPGIFLSKCIGLAYDTMGTNPHCYYILEKIFADICGIYDLTMEEVRQSLCDSSDSLYRSSNYKWGVVVDYKSFHTFPSLQRIKSIFNTDPGDKAHLEQLTRKPYDCFTLSTIE